ncbi:ABC transporter ATP-binding protein [Clostridia bacterium]|nr:ABC transporter ATP-binding protein [Clostridia bacterium]
MYSLTMGVMIQAENLRKVYRIGNEKVAALAGIDLTIEQGEVCCIVGQSGSGKSTLLNMLAGLEKPTRGRITIAGERITEMDEDSLTLFRQKNLGFIFQSYNLLPRLTATENAALPLLFHGVDKTKRNKAALRELREMGIENRAHHKPSEMSGGQQQRVAIARAFVVRPKVIFADEPTGNLDSETTMTVMQTMLDRAARFGITFVMVTHEPDLSLLCDRTITLRDGKIISDERNENKITEELK